MSGDERARHCKKCNHEVINLSAMTKEEAEAVLEERQGDLCVTYRSRDGRMLHQTKRKGLLALLATVLPLAAIVGCGSSEDSVIVTTGDTVDHKVQTEGVTMGKLAPVVRQPDGKSKEIKRRMGVLKDGPESSGPVPD
ncbi:MAG: hypothetical protein JSS72_09660 [Armatimonadetes bacterium]|nr:hypothetical protein [Armatimonadota bacterium]